MTRENMTDTINGVNTHNGHGFVDLGLPSGLLWATCNVGATSPEQTGLYFAWGEIEGFSIKRVKNGKRSFDEEIYNTKPAASISENLTLEQDAANHYMGGKWRMPTQDEFQELIDNCSVVWTKNYNRTWVAGMVFTSKINGNSVFFPDTGICYGSSAGTGGEAGCYWSASWNSTDSSSFLFFYKDYIFVRYGLRYCGRSVRGVYREVSSKEKVDRVENMSRVIDVLTDVAKEYSGKTIENIIVQMKSRVVELKK